MPRVMRMGIEHYYAMDPVRRRHLILESTSSLAWSAKPTILGLTSSAQTVLAMSTASFERGRPGRSNPFL